jgi:hypothetical protein
MLSGCSGTGSSTRVILMVVLVVVVNCGAAFKVVLMVGGVGCWLWKESGFCGSSVRLVAAVGF